MIVAIFFSGLNMFKLKYVHFILLDLCVFIIDFEVLGTFC